MHDPNGSLDLVSSKLKFSKYCKHQLTKYTVICSKLLQKRNIGIIKYVTAKSQRLGKISLNMGLLR